MDILNNIELIYCLIIMNIKKLLIATIAVIGITACSPDSPPPPDVHTMLRFVNQSSHKIELMFHDVNESIEIKSGATSEKISHYAHLLDVCIIEFDDKVKFDYNTINTDCEFDIRFGVNYDSLESGQYDICYTYTFTDADYQFALENGTVVE